MKVVQSLGISVLYAIKGCLEGVKVRGRNEMSNQKWMKLLINYKWGDPNSCYYTHDPPRPAAWVVHENFKPVDLRDFYKQYGEKEFPKTEQRALRKIHPKQADERFLCRGCLESYYLNDTSKFGEDGQANYTYLSIQDWKKKDYKSVEQAVTEHLIELND
jgi:hypothetical protein